MMTQRHTRQPIRIYRGTLDEVFSHRAEIPAGATVELKVFDPQIAEEKIAEETATMALMRAWLEEDATDDPAEKEAAQQELDDFKRNMNRWRKEVGSLPLYPEVE